MFPTPGYGIEGAVWYQGDFSFYRLHLAAHLPEKPAPGDSNWAELSEAQTKTMKLPHTDQAVLTGLGEAKAR